MNDDEPEEEVPLGEALEATAWRIVRASYLAVACHYIGKRPEALEEEEAEALLERWHGRMEMDVRALGACFVRAHHGGVEDVHVLLHGAEGLDHEMLDQAVECAVADRLAIGSEEG